MTKVEEAIEKVAEAKKRKMAQQLEVNKARTAWEEEIDKQYKIQVEIYQLEDELREAKQAAFDEDGMLVNGQMQE